VWKLRNAAVADPRSPFFYGLIVAAVSAVLGVYRPAVLARVDYRAYDGMLARAPSPPPTGRVVIVDIDERSLRALGQWPWRRDVLARLISRLREAGAAVIALDIVFAESERIDRATPDSAGDARRAPPLDAVATPDAALTETLRAGRVVIGYAFQFGSAPNQSVSCVLHPIALAIVQQQGDGPASGLFRASSAVCNLPALAEAAGSSGFLNAVSDADGILRRAPLLIEFNGRVYPALTLAAVMAAVNARQVVLRIDNANATSLLLDDRRVPLDGKGNLLLNYRGKKDSFVHVSAADVVSSPFDGTMVKDKLVLVGATAPGAHDTVTTPLDTLVTGVEVQATIADNLIGQDFLSRPGLAPIVESLVTFALGIAVAFLIVTAGPLAGSLGSVGCVGAMWIAARWSLLAQRLFFSPVVPSIGSLAGLGVVLLASVALERQRANKASADRMGAQRLMIESLLSLAEIRDADTGRHSRRTQLYARLLAEQLARDPRYSQYLTNERIDLLSRVAPLHDIGKVGIPDYLLNKAGPLTDDERAEMRKHPIYGRDVITRAEQQVGVLDDSALAMAKEIVYTHHEWWDGRGYPRGLQGEQIPISARVVMLVDVYDALTTRRVYRQPVMHDKAVGVIVEGRGTHFDPAVVDAFVQIAGQFQGISVENLRLEAKSATF
jgi:adenylate cyclase